jgi:hypothetical protein
VGCTQQQQQKQQQNEDSTWQSTKAVSKVQVVQQGVTQCLLQQQ